MGILFGLLTAVFTSLQNTYFRKLSDANTYVINWVRLLVGLPIIAALVTAFGTWAIPPPMFWILLVGISIPVEFVLLFCYTRAFQLSDQSLVGPLFSITTIFLLPLGFFVLGELPTIAGIGGVLLIFFGTFTLGFQKGKYSPLFIFSQIFKERGAYYMFGAALLASIAVINSKFLFQYGSPLLFAFYLSFLLFVIYTIPAYRHRHAFSKGHIKDMGILGFIFGFTSVFHFVGLSLIHAAYFISIKRTSILFDVFLGKIVHKEKHFRKRLLGAFFMLLGIVLIAFG